MFHHQLQPIKLILKNKKKFIKNRKYQTWSGNFFSQFQNINETLILLNYKL